MTMRKRLLLLAFVAGLALGTVALCLAEGSGAKERKQANQTKYQACVKQCEESAVSQGFWPGHPKFVAVVRRCMRTCTGRY
jgi:hypothetical protein